MKTLPVFLLMLILVACNTKHVTSTTSYSDRTKDSIVYVDQVTIDTVKLPTETLTVHVPFEVFVHDTVVEYRNGRASTKIIYRDGKVTINTQCDSLEKLVLSRQREIYQLKQSNKNTSTETKEKIVKRVPWYYKAALTLFVGLVLFLSIRLIIKTYFPFRG